MPSLPFPNSLSVDNCHCYICTRLKYRLFKQVKTPGEILVERMLREYNPDVDPNTGYPALIGCDGI
jgi:hypothetical protein